MKQSTRGQAAQGSTWSELPAAPGEGPGAGAQLPHPNGPTVDEQTPPCPVAFSGSHWLLDASPAPWAPVHGRLLPLTSPLAQGPQPFPCDMQQMKPGVQLPRVGAPGGGRGGGGRGSVPCLPPPRTRASKSWFSLIGWVWGLGGVGSRVRQPPFSSGPHRATFLTRGTPQTPCPLLRAWLCSSSCMCSCVCSAHTPSARRVYMSQMHPHAPHQRTFPDPPASLHCLHIARFLCFRHLPQLEVRCGEDRLGHTSPPAANIQCPHGSQRGWNPERGGPCTVSPHHQHSARGSFPDRVVPAWDSVMRLSFPKPCGGLPTWTTMV